ncbi:MULTISPECIES: ABC transporter substrate-binding protein [Streptomycetaceae]|uniref:ABC transporter substrate-binding protein n=1 Tax=Streptomycetaceae TaxID=2062 RepID=UPI00093C388F|nr:MULTISPECIES: ABC transporter substrate-binding protein [Streptomycetaceae]MDQ0310559.1 polar amino acid transport system substrate-binding protein [Kitasatospora herbaricolor]OKI19526.1 ABC transporter substrate-binding protein [Streptomyces sp. CB03911]GGV08107.1 ABC transporter substrate-binding protein [Kitasatospora herbaricolor]
MTARTPRTRLLAACAVLASATLALTACGSSGDSTSGSGSTGASAGATVKAVTADPALAALVPADIKSGGKLVVGSDASYAPNEFQDDKGTIVGMDVDLANAIAAKLGLKAEVQNAGFTAIIPGIGANKYQLGMSSFTDTKEREQTVDMVTYFTAGTASAVKKGNPDKISADDLCGKKIAVQTGTTQADAIVDVINPACVKAGKPTVPNDGDKFDLQTDVTNAVVSGRDQVMMADSPVIDYALKQTGGQLEKLGATTDSAPYGIALAKGSALTPAVQKAVQALMDDGTYKEILQKWGVDAGAIDKAQLNGATS